MDNLEPRRKPLSRMYCFTAIPALIIMLAAIANDARADGSEKYPKCFVGTYLVDEGNGTKSLWSFGDRGVFLITSSAQSSLNFSNGQGAWIRAGKLRVSVISVDFSFETDGGLANIAKVNAEVTFTDNTCGEAEGEFTVSFYTTDVDPLDPNSVPENVVSDTFTGRRVKVE
jgi:hypothetical protein